VDRRRQTHPRARPDKNGNALPADLTFGSYQLSDLTNRGVGNLFGGKVVYDKTYGHVTYGCLGCCGYKGPHVWYSPLAFLFKAARPKESMPRTLVIVSTRTLATLFMAHGEAQIPPSQPWITLVITQAYP